LRICLSNAPEGTNRRRKVTQSVFAGNFTVSAKVTKGTPIITVKPNAAAPEAVVGAGAVEQFAATISDAAKTAQVVASQPRQSTGRPELTEAAIVVSGAIQHRAGIADLEDHRGGQQGRRGPDLRAGRLRCHGRPAHGPPRADPEIVTRKG